MSIDLKKQLSKSRKEFSRELESILSFWEKYGVDKINNGFHGEISNDLQVNEGAGKGGILNARILWTFSSASQFTGKRQYKEMADKSYHYFVEKFLDHEYGGTFWMLSPDGKPLETRKQVYAQAFSIYGLSEYARISSSHEPVQLAMEIMDLIELHALDKKHNGYIEAFDRHWRVHKDQRLSAIDMNERKSMNTHLHIIEAFTNLFSVTDNPKVKNRVENLLDIFCRFIIDDKTHHFKLFFDDAWNLKSNKISYGHDIEGSWLLPEAAKSIGSEDWTNRMNLSAVDMAKATFEGIDADGGLKYEHVPGEKSNGEKEWWTLAEAVVGFFNAYQLTGEQDFREKSSGMWNFIRDHFIDEKNGEWFYRIDAKYQPLQSFPKVSAWKCPYHNSRMCIEMIRRIEQVLEKV